MSNLNINKGVTLYTPVITAHNRCPHGAPGGACPICSGSGGGGGSSSKPVRTPGLMNWNEAYYEFMRLNNLKANVQESKDLAQLSNVRMAMELRLAQMLQGMKLASFISIIGNPSFLQLQNVINSIKESSINTLKQISWAVDNQITQMKTFIRETGENIADKLAAIFGEELKMLRDFIKESFKKLLIRLSEMNIFQRLFKTQWDPEESLKDVLIESLLNAKSKILSLFFGEKNEDEENNKEGKKENNKTQNKEGKQ